MKFLLPFIIGVALLLTACASIGRPEGGPRDETPPRYVSSNPLPGATDFTGNKIVLEFDENVQLTDPGNKVVISPTQTQMPSISSNNGRRITIELKDSMLPGTTYTIDMADAIKDFNEGNVLDGFAIDFSTGPTIDSLQISGMVLEGRTLEPAQGMLVGVYATEADSAISTLRFDRIAKTNQLGQFTVRGLKPGCYQLFAVNDVNRDYHWDRSEDVAFLGSLVCPSAELTEVVDTLLDVNSMDSLAVRPATRFTPDDVLLTWFNEHYTGQYLKEHGRADRRAITLEFAAEVDTLPELEVVAIGSRKVNILLNESNTLLERSMRADSLRYWLTDTMLINADSLLIATRYRRTDSLSQLSWQQDTIKFNMRVARGKKGKKGDEGPKYPRGRTLQNRIDSVLAISDTIPIDTFALSQPDNWLKVEVEGGGAQDLHRPLFIKVDQPLAHLDSAAVHLQMKADTVWVDAPGQAKLIPADSVARLRYRMDYPWQSGQQYRLVLDSMGLVSIYGTYNMPRTSELMAKSIEEYSTVIFNLTGLPSDTVPVMVELLDSHDEPVAVTRAENGQAVLPFINPGTYYARLYMDADANGRYTDGSLTEGRQPEDTYYYPKKLTLKKNWDLEQAWNVTDLPVDVQKPLDIKQNKPKKKAGEQQRTSDDDEEEEEDEFADYGTGFRGSRMQPTMR